jgi:hypothetical protein
MNEFKSANKKALKSNSSHQSQHHSEQQVRIHQDVIIFVHLL